MHVLLPTQSWLLKKATTTTTKSFKLSWSCRAKLSFKCASLNRKLMKKFGLGKQFFIFVFLIFMRTVSTINRPCYRYGGHIDLRSIMGCSRGFRSVFMRAFRAKRELRCIFIGKKAIIITPKHGTTIFFFPIECFSRKT